MMHRQGHFDARILKPYAPSSAEDSALMEARSRRSFRRTPEGLAALSATSHPVLITDNTRPDNPIVYVNWAFRRLTGYRDLDVVGRNCRFLQGIDTDPAVIAELRTAASSVVCWPNILAGGTL
ncbi:PAS domain-containing protein [Pacificimonas sp. ICDLI1SI03]